MGNELGWADVGAVSKRDFSKQCRQTWVDETRGLTSRELELGLTVCSDAGEVVSDWTCEDVVARYGASAPQDSADSGLP